MDTQIFLLINSLKFTQPELVERKPLKWVMRPFDPISGSMLPEVFVMCFVVVRWKRLKAGNRFG